jgi:hypothetical protein
LTPNWRDLGNAPDVDEYIRRQTMTAHDYRVFLDRLAQQFPADPFLVLRYGDHQPQFGARLVDPSLSEDERTRQLEARDVRYFTTYYAIDALNFVPADLSLALDTLESPYLPLVLQVAAGIPLGASFAEQKTILTHCHGIFYACDGGSAVRRFNRMLMNAGLIRGL